MVGGDGGNLIVTPGMRSKACALKLKTQSQLDADLSFSNRADAKQLRYNDPFDRGFSRGFR